jgi:hypothetical protein
MLNRYFLALTMVSLGAWAVLPASAAETVFPPGSRVGLVPPSDMAVSKRFLGFEAAEKGAAITLIELPPQAVADLRAGLNDTVLKAQGLTVENREQIEVLGAPTDLVSGQQSAGGFSLRKWLMVAADPTLTAFVIAQTPSDGSYPEEAIREALRTIAFRAPLSIEDQVAALPFRLGERSGLRPVRTTTGNALLLTEGRNDAINPAEQPLVVVALAAEPPPPPAMRNEVARNTLFANPSFKELVIERADAFRQRGIDWHETVGRAKDAQTGEPLVVMQTIQFSTRSYLRLLGIARAETRENLLPRLRALADGLELK